MVVEQLVAEINIIEEEHQEEDIKVIELLQIIGFVLEHKMMDIKLVLEKE